MSKEIFIVYKDTRYHSHGAVWAVSNLGRVKKNGEDYIPSENKGGYLAFGSKYYVHRAVGELFIPNPDPEHKKTIDHLNRDIHDNRACNLRWATMKEQAANRDNESIIKYALGYKHTLGKVWIFNPTTEKSTLIDPSELPDYLAKGYVRGRKIKHLCNA